MVVVGAASIMVLMARSEGVDDEIGRSGAHDEIGGEIGDEISDEIRRAVMRWVVCDQRSGDRDIGGKRE